MADTTNATIGGGIILYRSIILALQRYNFFLNPTNNARIIYESLTAIRVCHLLFLPLILSPSLRILQTEHKTEDMSRKNKNSGNGVVTRKPKTFLEYQSVHRELMSKRYVPIELLKPGRVRDISLAIGDAANIGAQRMSASMGCGSLSNGPLSQVAWSFDSNDTTPASVTDKDGKPMGRGYVKWGPKDNLPGVIYSLAKASPYTAAPLRYLSDLATGLGVRLMYRFEDDTYCEFAHAGYNLRIRLQQARKGEQQDEYGGDMAMDPAAKPGEDPLKPISEIAPENRPRPRLQGIGPDYWEEAYYEWQRSWEGYDQTDPDGNERHIPGVRQFQEENNLDLHLSQCMLDCMMYDLYFPTVGLERGRRGQWDPRIVKIGQLKITDGIRYEAMSEYRHIQHVYFGERFRAKGIGEHNTIGAHDDKVTMYPVCEATARVSDMRYLVSANQRTRINARPTWAVCPVYYGNKNYYQQPDWWSIFTSKAYDFSSTILYDKAKQRENNTTWGRIIYISLDYLDMVFADNGIAGDKDKQQKFIDELDQNVETFLQQRENNGKMMRQFMWLGQDGKDHHNVEIVDVKETTNDAVKAGKEELELSTSPMFLAFGVDPRDIGVPMVSASNGGTALREIRLMKQQLLNVRQRMYIRFLQDVFTFNRFDPHLTPVIRQMSFTTLDRNPTGTVETIAGEGA